MCGTDCVFLGPFLCSFSSLVGHPDFTRFPLNYIYIQERMGHTRECICVMAYPFPAGQCVHLLGAIYTGESTLINLTVGEDCVYTVFLRIFYSSRLCAFLFLSYIYIHFSSKDTARRELSLKIGMRYSYFVVLGVTLGTDREIGIFLLYIL